MSYRWEKVGKAKGREGPSKVLDLPFSLSLPYCHGRPCQGYHASLILIGPGSGFTLASGHVPSSHGERCGAVSQGAEP